MLEHANPELKSIKVVYQSLWAILLILLLSACSTAKPPTEFAPDGEIVKRAVLLQLEQTEKRLSQGLNFSQPALEIPQINVKQIEPILVAELPAYHLQGTYNLTLIFPRQKVTQKNNNFEIYLQRQIEGKTWRLLRREVNTASGKVQWESYLIDNREIYPDI